MPKWDPTKPLFQHIITIVNITHLNLHTLYIWPTCEYIKIAGWKGWNLSPEIKPRLQQAHDQKMKGELLFYDDNITTQSSPSGIHIFVCNPNKTQTNLPPKS